MRIASITFTLLAATLALPVAAASLPPETPIVVDGAVKVDAGDIEGFIQRIPAERRAEARASSERIASYADALFIARSLAAKAREAGLDKDPLVQRRLVQAQDSVLADLYLQHVDKSAPMLDLEVRARELYNGDPARFTSPEHVYVQHLLVGLNGRTREMAEERARKIYEEAKSGKEDFLALAARMSDDPDKKRNGGDLGYNSPTRFVEPLAKQIASMSAKGEISPPVESHQGFHIVRFVDRKKAALAPFEDVKRGIIAVERDRIAKKRHEDVLGTIRGSSTVTVHRANVDALVVPIDDVLSRAAAADAGKPR
jgi:peptidyl-prolyl cis-trans isomerase C